MIEYYRIVRRDHVRSPLGFGHAAGRWNQRNTPVIYACSSVALSMTEYLSIKGTQVLTSQWSLITYAIETDIPSLDKSSLPDEWDTRPHPLTTQHFGTEWLESKASVCLQVPSARLLLSAYPREHNLLINPVHSELTTTVSVKSTEDLYFHLNEWASGNMGIGKSGF